MIFEMMDFGFSQEKLLSHLEKHVLPFEATFQSSAFGGWSVLSSNGSHKDGWHQGHLMYCQDLDKEKVKAHLKEHSAKRTSEYTLPTEICHGYLQEVLEKIAASGLSPARARIIQLAAGGASSWHRDYPDDVYGVRLHVPIKTNPDCFFETEQERAHLPANGMAYFIFVNRVHRVINNGTEHRYHLVMDIKDNAGLTRFHSLEYFNSVLKERIKST